MNIEKFSTSDGKSGYRIKGATFASSRNNNGAYFDPVEVFSLDNPPKKFNLGHKDYTTDYSTGTEIVNNPTPKIEGKILRFTWDLETTNENFISLIEKENFGGFSPELKPKNHPVKSDVGERFYRSGDLHWIDTAILEKGQKPGFVGANEYELEKFEAFEDVVIEQFEEKPKANSQASEHFALIDDLTEQMRWMKDAQERNEKLLKDLAIAISALNQTESFEGKNKPAEDPKPENQEPEPDPEQDPKEKENFEKAKQEAEHFNQVQQAKAAIDSVKPVQHGAEVSQGKQSEAAMKGFEKLRIRKS